MGTFKERIQWVGDPRWKDGSIVIHNLDYSDNGTFTCDVKNPPDIVGKTSQVTLYVFEKGVRGSGNMGWGVLGRPGGLGEEAVGLDLALQALGGGEPLTPQQQGANMGLRTKGAGPCSLLSFSSLPS